jgi:beta-fructofuranosidase
LQVDVEISFRTIELQEAEKLDPSWTNPQALCSQKGASVKGQLGPFGLLALASEGLQEQTAVFFRIFKGQDKYVVLMCSDQSRYIFFLCPSIFFTKNSKISTFIYYYYYYYFSGGRSSLNNGNDKTTYGAFLDVDPSHEELSLRGLVSCCYEIVI